MTWDAGSLLAAIVVIGGSCVAAYVKLRVIETKVENMAKWLEKVANANESRACSEHATRLNDHDRRLTELERKVC